MQQYNVILTINVFNNDALNGSKFQKFTNK